MAAPKQPTHEVVHGKLYLAVDGKLQRVPQGSKVILSEEVAAGLGGKVESLKEKKTLKVGIDEE